MRSTQLIAGFAVALALVLIGSLGYMAIEGWPFLDSLFMTVISLSTVGYGETHHLSTSGRIFTIGLLVVGVGLVLFLATRATEVLIQGNIRRVLGRRKMDKTIERLKNHFVICGYGRLGRKMVAILKNRGIETVVIERSAAVTAQMEEEGDRYILGQATDDEVLRRAGIERARGLVAGVNTDADNLYITLSARSITSDLYILARIMDPSAEPKFRMAGANEVISPVEIGAQRMAQSILDPTVVDFLDLAMADDRQVPVHMEALSVGPEAQLAGKALKDSGIRAELNLIVVAIKMPDGKMLFNPGPEDAIETGATLIVIGPDDKLARLGELLDSGTGQPFLAAT